MKSKEIKIESLVVHVGHDPSIIPTYLAPALSIYKVEKKMGAFTLGLSTREENRNPLYFCLLASWSASGPQESPPIKLILVTGTTLQIIIL